MPAIRTGPASPRRSVCTPGSILMVSQAAFYPKGGSVMQPHKIEQPVEPSDDGQTSRPRQPERKRRFQIVNLEQRIAPGKGNSGWTWTPGHCKPPF
jgi:hypothetical protein